MGSLFRNDEPSSAAQLQRNAGLSIAVHALVLGLIAAGTIHLRHVVIFRPTTAGSVTQVSMIALNRSALDAILNQRSPVVERDTVPKLLAPHRQKPMLNLPQISQSAPSSQSAPAAGKTNPGVTGAGNDGQSMYPAYPTVSPSPEVKDRALLPQTDQRVIVNVNLSADGHVQQATLVSGLGNALDQIVLDTVRGWQFHPAQVNGSPVASSIELVFPFNRSYPISE